MFTLGLVIFWAGVTALMGAGLVVYELKPDTVNSGQTQEQTKTQTRTYATTSTSQLNLAAVATHNQVTDCWIIVEGNAYNVSDYIPFHPGGEQMIINNCGRDATDNFNDRDGEGTSHSSSARAQLEKYLVGKLGASLEANTETTTSDRTETNDTITNDVRTEPIGQEATKTTPTQVTTALTSTEVAQHTSGSDCWVIVDGNVYNVSDYIPFHPGGSNRIVSRCGTDISADFAGGGGHRHSSSARNTLSRYLVGALGESVTKTTQTSSTDPIDTSNSGGSNPIESSIQAKYPGAVIIKVEYEDDGRSEVKFNWNGEKYEAKLNSQNEIVDVDD